MRLKILVTGGAGFIGSHTVDALLEKGCEVKILDSLSPPVHKRGQKPDYVSNDAEFILGNIQRKGDVAKALQGVDVVFHLIAHQGYSPHFGRFALVNDYGTALLYEVIVERRLLIRKVILASSQAVYGEGLYYCEQCGIRYQRLKARSIKQLERGDWEIMCSACGDKMFPIPTGESTVNPHNQYAVSKYCQELYAMTLGKRYGIPTVVLRYSITQGERQSFHNAYSGILRSFTVRLLNDKSPIIYEDGGQLRDYVYAGDVVKANLLAMERDDMDYQDYNVGGDKPVTVLEYAEILGRVLGKSIGPKMRGEFRFGDSRHIISDSSKLRRLGWENGTSIEQTAKEYVEWAEGQPNVRDYYSEAHSVMRRQGILRSIK